MVHRANEAALARLAAALPLALEATRLIAEVVRAIAAAAVTIAARCTRIRTEVVAGVLAPTAGAGTCAGARPPLAITELLLPALADLRLTLRLTTALLASGLLLPNRRGRSCERQALALHHHRHRRRAGKTLDHGNRLTIADGLALALATAAAAALALPHPWTGLATVASIPRIPRIARIRRFEVRVAEVLAAAILLRRAVRWSVYYILL